MLSPSLQGYTPLVGNTTATPDFGRTMLAMACQIRGAFVVMTSRFNQSGIIQCCRLGNGLLELWIRDSIVGLSDACWFCQKVASHTHTQETYASAETPPDRGDTHTCAMPLGHAAKGLQARKADDEPLRRHQIVFVGMRGRGRPFSFFFHAADGSVYKRPSGLSAWYVPATCTQIKHCGCKSLEESVRVYMGVCGLRTRLSNLFCCNLARRG